MDLFLLIPVLLYFWRCWGWRRAAAIAVVQFPPIMWSVGSINKFASLGISYLWSVVLAALLFWELYRETSDDPASSIEPG